MPVDIEHGSLFVQCLASQAFRAAPIADRRGGGLVVTAQRRDLHDALSVAEYLMRSSTPYRGPILLDAARYAGENRLPASAPFNPRWRRRQRDLGLPVLTDSGYLAAADGDGLRLILRNAATADDTIALLPLHLSWLTDPAMRRMLRYTVRQYGVPVALVLESKRDPFAAQGAVDGLVELLDAGPPVLLLRSDVSALGALCAGAMAAAVGTTGSLRHLYPRDDVSRRPLRTAKTSVVFRATLSYKWVSSIARARHRHPGEPIWACECEVCEGRPVDWLNEVDEQQRDYAAFRHSMHVLFQLRDELNGNPRSWNSRCTDALSRTRELGWERNRALDRWVSVHSGLPRSIRAVR
jgi:hypothetical protein